MTDEKKSSTSGAGGESEVKSRMDEIQEKGYDGEVADETPNSAYTVKGVTSGAKTPEAKDSKLDAQGNSK